MESTRQAVSSWSVLNLFPHEQSLQEQAHQEDVPGLWSSALHCSWTQTHGNTWAQFEKFLFELSALWHPTDSHVSLMQFFTWETHLNNSLSCHYLACTISTATDSHSLPGWAKKKNEKKNKSQSLYPNCFFCMWFVPVVLWASNDAFQMRCGLRRAGIYCP